MRTLLELNEISKTFPGVRALHRASLDVRPGEVLALMGENGAGKSTLIKSVAGVYQPDEGRIVWQGRAAAFRSPAEAQRAGIAVIYQEFNLVPAMSVQENLFLGKEGGALRFAGGAEESRRAREVLQRAGLAIDPRTPVRRLSVGQQQSVEISRALLADARLVIMDEPTAALSHQEVEKLFAIIEALKNDGVSIIYVSHRLDEIFAISDRITVMRDGEVVGTRPTAETTRRELIRMMVGRDVENEYPKVQATPGETVLEVEGLRRGGAVRGVGFSLRRGEVLGFAGLVGAGRTETMRLLAGVDLADGGLVRIHGKDRRFATPRQAIRAGVCLLPEDRKAQGLTLGHTVAENFFLPNAGHFSRGGFVRRRSLLQALQGFIDSIRIRLRDPQQKVKNLSGGNQQKVVLAKWLQRNTEIIIFDEPTRGVDVGAKAEIYQLINQLAANGKAIILVSSELAEVLGMADRVVVMHEGRVKGMIDDPQRATQEDVLRMAIGA